VKDFPIYVRSVGHLCVQSAAKPFPHSGSGKVERRDRACSIWQTWRDRLSESHFRTLIYYVHTNAQLHGICDDFRDWTNSSYASILSDGSSKLLREAVLGRFDCKVQFEQYHKEYLDLKNIEDLIIED